MFCEYYLNKGAEGAEVFTGEITFGICFQSTSVKIKNRKKRDGWRKKMGKMLITVDDWW